MRIPRIDPELRKIADALLRAGKKAYLVGGAVRDTFLHRQVTDFDIATNATPEECMQIFPRAIPTGIRHGTITVIPRSRRFKVEITTFRLEGKYSDGRRPDSVAFIDDITIDLSRRDFTINAMAIDLENSHFIDPYGGKSDIAKKVIRAVGTPSERFSEDGLRTIRAVRFATQLDFAIEPATFEAIKECSEKLSCVSRERIRDEFSKILLAPKPSSGIRLLVDTKLIQFILPDILPCKGVPQPKNLHRLDVFEHLLATVDAVYQDNLSEEHLLVLRLAALLHDIGKPRTLNISEDGTISFFRHEIESEAIARKILQDLKYPNETIDRVCHLIRHHMFNYESGWTDAAVRRFVARVGQRAIPDLFALRLADTIATVGEPLSWPLLSEFQSRIDRILEEKQAISLRDLAVNGEDLASIGIPRNKEMGTLLSELLEAVLEDQSLNTREKLLEIAKAKYFNVKK